MASIGSKQTSFFTQHARKEKSFGQKTIDSQNQNQQTTTIRQTPLANRLKDYYSSSEESEQNYDYLKKSQLESPSLNSEEEEQKIRAHLKQRKVIKSTSRDRGAEDKTLKTIGGSSIKDSHSKFKPIYTKTRNPQVPSKSTIDQRRPSQPQRTRGKSILTSSDDETSQGTSPPTHRKSVQTKSKGKKPQHARKSSKSILKKTQKSQKENAAVSQKRKHSQSISKLPQKNERPETLAQRLLLDITEKYKNLSVAQHSCYINKLEKKTMIHEINTLANALIRNEKKYVKLQDKDKGKMREYRKVIRNYEDQMKFFEQDLKQLNDNIRSLKENEEYLVSDLNKQQKIAKEALRALENLSDKYDKEKREMIVRMEKEKEELVKKEEQKFEYKVQSLKSLNEQLNLKLGTLNETEDDFMAVQKNYQEATQIIEDQKRELQSMYREGEEMKERNRQLEEEVKEAQGMLQEQQKVYSQHIGELRVQLNELEDATRNKYEEQVVQMQMELKLKQDQINRVNQEKEQVEKKFKQKIDEVGQNSKQAQKEIFTFQEEKEDLQKQLRNQEFELEKLKRVIINKEEEFENERKRFAMKYERKQDELEKERQEFNELYHTLQKEMAAMKQLVQEKDQQLSANMRRSLEGGISMRTSMQGSPIKGVMQGMNQNQMVELQEQIKTKDEEIKILWNVIKEINKGKGNEKFSIENLKFALGNKFGGTTNLTTTLD